MRDCYISMCVRGEYNMSDWSCDSLKYLHPYLLWHSLYNHFCSWKASAEYSSPVLHSCIEVCLYLNARNKLVGKEQHVAQQIRSTQISQQTCVPFITAHGSQYSSQELYIYKVQSPFPRSSFDTIPPNLWASQIRCRPRPSDLLRKSAPSQVFAIAGMGPPILGRGKFFSLNRYCIFWWGIYTCFSHHRPQAMVFPKYTHLQKNNFSRNGPLYPQFTAIQDGDTLYIHTYIHIYIYIYIVYNVWIVIITPPPATIKPLK